MINPGGINHALKLNKRLHNHAKFCSIQKLYVNGKLINHFGSLTLTIWLKIEVLLLAGYLIVDKLQSALDGGRH